MEVEEDDEVMVHRGGTTIESFTDDGPTHLTSPDWYNPVSSFLLVERNDSYYRTAVASCLVQAVYILERDRQQNRTGVQALANQWWEFFNFTKAETLIDDSDGSIYGAIFHYKHFDHYNTTPSRPPPRQVIAFRGTIIKQKSFSRDLVLDYRILRDSLHESSTLKHAIDVIKKVVENTGNATVWLAGHSLGASLALLAGKKMMRSGSPLESYLFNPPFPSLPIEQLVMKNEILEHAVRLVGNFFKAVAAKALIDGHHYKGKEDDPFMKLASWIPNLYVNQSDLICSGYIGYFKHRTKARKIERIASRNSLMSLVSRGGEGGGSSAPDSSSLPHHLLPSADLTKNTTPSSNFKSAHGIHQWWKDRMPKSEFVSYVL